MERNKLNALFALMEAFPNERHFVSPAGVLHISIELSDVEADFFAAGAKLFEPA